MTDREDRANGFEGVPTYPKPNPAYVPVEVSPDEIQFRIGPTGGPVFTLSDDDGDGELSKLLESLDGRTHVRDVLAEFEPDQHPEVVQVLRTLASRNVIHSADDDAATDDLWQYTSVKPDLSHADFSALSDRRLVLFESGTVGDVVADGLSAHVDLERIDAAGDVWRDSPDDALTAAVREQISTADFVVCAVDRSHPRLFRAVNRAAHDARTPWVSGQVQGLDGFVGPTVFPTETACYECFTERLYANVPDFDDKELYRTEVEPNYASPLLPAMGHVVAGYLVIDVLHALTSGNAFTAGRTVHFDFFDLSVEANDVLKLPRCTVCGVAAGAERQRFAQLNDVIDSYRGE